MYVFVRSVRRSRWKKLTPTSQPAERVKKAAHLDLLGGHTIGEISVYPVQNDRDLRLVAVALSKKNWDDLDYVRVSPAAIHASGLQAIHDGQGETGVRIVDETHHFIRADRPAAERLVVEMARQCPPTETLCGTMDLRQDIRQFAIEFVNDGTIPLDELDVVAGHPLDVRSVVLKKTP